MVSIMVSTKPPVWCPLWRPLRRARLREFRGGQTIPPIPRRVDSSRRGVQVNVLKKVRTSQGWRLCPVVREANGRLRDRARVGGRIEVHAEGVCYLEWREEGRRLRAAIPNAAEVLERARLKSLELEARQTGIALNALRPVLWLILINCSHAGQWVRSCDVCNRAIPADDRYVLSTIAQERAVLFLTLFARTENATGLDVASDESVELAICLSCKLDMAGMASEFVN